MRYAEITQYLLNAGWTETELSRVRNVRDAIRRGAVKAAYGKDHIAFSAYWFVYEHPDYEVFVEVIAFIGTMLVRIVETDDRQRYRSEDELYEGALRELDEVIDELRKHETSRNLHGQ